jgi:hypothetical protein
VRHYFAVGLGEGPHPQVHIVEILGPLDGGIEPENRVDVRGVPTSHLLGDEHSARTKDSDDLCHHRGGVAVQHHVEGCVREAKMPCFRRFEGDM